MIIETKFDIDDSVYLMINGILFKAKIRKVCASLTKTFPLRIAYTLFGDSISSSREFLEDELHLDKNDCIDVWAKNQRNKKFN